MSDAKRTKLDVDSPGLAAWLSTDKNAATLAEAEALRDKGDAEEIKSRFDVRMAFGTAGLRARMGAGYACMNELTVLQASQGLSSYVKASFKGDIAVVVGYDGRHNSHVFATRTAAAFLAKGIHVHLFSKIVPTPYVAYAVSRLKCAVGVMVTASHNPKEDNGYKVYWDNGAQIISPHDKNISAHILENVEPWADAWDSAFVSNHAACTDPYEEIEANYMKDLQGLASSAPTSKGSIPIVYSAMHGVGYHACKLAFESNGLAPLIPVVQQCDPDPDFPTVTYPNPEEGKGALKLAFETAEANDSTVVLANDPDADRLAVAAKHQGSWRIFTGNEIGALFGAWAWKTYKEANPTADFSKACMLSSTVSSMILQTMAQKEGFYFEDTLTGFKWMGNRARELQKEGYQVLLSFEEAIGFAHGTHVVDKDGVSAAVLMAQMANTLADRGMTLVDQLHAVYAEYGYHATKGSYYICRSQPTIDAIFNAIRKDGKYQMQVQDQTISHVRDLTTGYDSRQADKKALLPTQSSNMITFYLANDSVITLRTSGTEPKIKYYSEIKAPATTAEERAAVDAQLAVTVEQIVNTLLQPAKYNLVGKAD